MSREGGNKMSVLVHAQGIKTVHAGGRGQKMAKLYPRSCWITPNGAYHLFDNWLSLLSCPAEKSSVQQSTNILTYVVYHLDRLERKFYIVKRMKAWKKIIYCKKNERNRRTCSCFSAEGHSKTTYIVCGPNFTQVWPTTPLERIIVDILHCDYLK